MNSPPRILDLADLAWAFGLIAISIGLLQWQRVGLAGQMALAAARSLLQLLVMGFGLQIIWQIDRPWVTVAGICAIAVATTIASYQPDWRSDEEFTTQLSVEPSSRG